MNFQMQSQSGVDITILAGGIWEALITTIGGLIVGIFAIILYNDLVQNLENTAKDLQDATLDYMIKIENIRSGVQ
ncbi:MAG: MotA/TolQ/ExbB proton channel family protein, partial [Candidatus Cloacimonetes bacterium]|nr:MotA/TolQ/ExbB proton channel family protein [Candidatus Cloacimonadota bacterium]